MATTSASGGEARTSGSLGGIFRRAAGSGHWEQLRKGLPEALSGQAITVHPTNSDVVYLGGNRGLYRSTDRGERWERLGFSDEQAEVWSVLVHPVNPRTLYAGTSPVGVYRSDDGGETWRKLPNATLPDRIKMSFACRVMRLAVDPARADEVYATLEVGGVIRSLDGGETWDDCTSGLLEMADRPHLKSRIQSDSDAEGMLDGHALCV